ncbi:hypothetical protein RDI58_010768 [Solanum bulbocastanum]|uniref:DUF4283 domain-containing protein n=1 Tax=Solanum bulbocastanum TaxID=147425 RepID=A0AAN8TUG5_SOLBU
MAAAASPQSQTVGKSNLNNTYASLMNYNPTALTKTILKPIQLIHGEPTVRFTFKELDEYVVEEGLHLAVIMKLPYGAPSLHELRKLIPKQLVIKGRCLIGSLAARHLLIRCYLYEDFCSVLSKQFGYLQFNGEQHLFRNFSWTQNFNPKEETSKALAWISLPDLPPNLFARRPLLSIASAIGAKVQEGFLVPGPEVQLLNISGKSLADAPKTSDKVQGYQEGDTCVISCEDQVGPNAGRVLDRNSIATSKFENSEQQTCQTEVAQQLSYNATEKESVTATGVVRVGSEPANTTNDKIEIQEKTTNSKAFVVVSQVASEKLLTEDVAINTAATFVAQIKEHVQSKIVDKAGLTVDVGAQISSPGASLIKPHVTPKLNMVNSHALPIVSISQATSTNNLITSSRQKGVTSES